MSRRVETPEDARAYVQEQQAAGIGTEVDPETWVRSIVAHLQPLPANRQWAVRYRGGRRAS